MIYMTAFRNYYADLEQKGAKLKASSEMMAIYDCSGITSLLWWWIQSDFTISKETMVNYLALKTRQSFELIHF